MSIGTTSLCHVAILVEDIEKAVENWAALLGLEKPKIWYYPPDEKVPSFTDGKRADNTDVKLAVFELSNVKIELVEPGSKPSAYRDAMDRHGPGLQHLSFIVPDRKQANETLEGIGAPHPYHIGYFQNGTYSFTDSTKQLGVEINIKTNDDNTEKVKKFTTDPDLYKADIL